MDKDTRTQGIIARENTAFQEDRRILVVGYNTDIDYAKLANKYEYGIKLKGVTIP